MTLPYRRLQDVVNPTSSARRRVSGLVVRRRALYTRSWRRINDDRVHWDFILKTKLFGFPVLIEFAYNNFSAYLVCPICSVLQTHKIANGSLIK